MSQTCPMAGQPLLLAPALHVFGVVSLGHELNNTKTGLHANINGNWSSWLLASFVLSMVWVSGHVVPVL